MKSKFIRGFDKDYKVRTDGTVWSKKKWKGKKTWRKLSPGKQKSGHLHVSLMKDGGRYQKLVHRLVLEAFVGPCPPGMECRHYPDQDPTNNRLENLSWAFLSVNQQDRKENGTGTAGEQHGAAKLTNQRVSRIRKLWRTGAFLQKELALMFDVHKMTISRVVRRKIWSHV